MRYFDKLSTNIKHYQMMWREQVSLLHLDYLQNYAPLKSLVHKPNPLNDSEILSDIFLKLGTNIKYHEAAEI